MATSSYLLENGTDKYLLEDGSGTYLLEQQPEDVFPDIGQVSATGFSPSLESRIQLGVGQLNANGFSPVLNSTIAINIASVLVTGFSPSLSIGTIVESNLGQLSANGFSPALDLQVNSVTGQVTATGLAPVVGINTLPGVGAAVANGFSPTINQSIQSNKGELTVIGFSPALNISITPGVSNTSLSGNPPTVSLPVVVATGVGLAAITGQAPVAGGVVGVTPLTGQLLASGFAPLVQLTDNKTVETEPGLLDLVGVSPSLIEEVRTNLGNIEAQGYSPVIIAPKILIPGIGEALLSSYAPSTLVGLPGVRTWEISVTKGSRRKRGSGVLVQPTTPNVRRFTYYSIPK